MRTFSRSDWEGALAAWEAGEFSDEWREVRHQAAMRGILYPPSGSKWDSWDDDQPSQRAILIRAIREMPRLLSEVVAYSRSWSDVIGKLLASRDDWREEVDRGERRAIARQLEEHPRPREAIQTVGAILTRMRESLP
jgi:hypothetical protein